MFSIGENLKSANVARTIRFTEFLFKQLNQFAFKNNVSFNALVLLCCQYALENYDNKNSPKND